MFKGIRMIETIMIAANELKISNPNNNFAMIKTLTKIATVIP